ncbi:hypothetical protein AAG906_005892 [Vitis piasezkii]
MSRVSDTWGPHSCATFRVTSTNFAMAIFSMGYRHYWEDFAEWVEAASYVRLTSFGVASFIISHIIYRYGVPHELISDREYISEWMLTLYYRDTVSNIINHLHTRATPYSLVYGMEVVLPIKIEMGSLRRKMAHAFKKWVKPRPLQRGDLVLKVIRGLIRDPRRKFKPNWSRPYFIRELTLEGASWLMDLDGNRFSEPTNVDQLKKYYV